MSVLEHQALSNFLFIVTVFFVFYVLLTLVTQVCYIFPEGNIDQQLKAEALRIMYTWFQCPVLSLLSCLL